MDNNHLALNRKQEELEQYIQSLNDPTLKRILQDISHIKRTIEIIEELEINASPLSSGLSQDEIVTESIGEPSNGISPLTKMGFSLIGSVKELIAQELFNEEFSQPIVYDRLVKKHPDVAPHIHRASVAATLSKLGKDNFISETHAGYGSDPKRYRFALNIPVGTKG